jgi:hypothetical protein
VRAGSAQRRSRQYPPARRCAAGVFPGQAFNDTLRSAATIAAAAREAQAQARRAALNDEDEAIVLLLLAA